MRQFTVTTVMLLSATMFALSPAFAQRAEDTAWKVQPTEFTDNNHDGINDRFRDANGDGVDDVSGKAYPHRFKFVDKDKDGVNDFWIDRDGDGVNDLSHKLDKKGRADADACILDFDRDGVNDVSGLKYGKADYHGSKHGFIDEDTGKIQGAFLDENGNGVDDRIEGTHWRRGSQNRDIFIDEDGDGICDGRGDTLRRHGDGGRHHRGGRH